MGNGVVEIATKEAATAVSVAADGSCVPATTPNLCGNNTCAFGGSTTSQLDCASGVQVPKPTDTFASPATCVGGGTSTTTPTSSAGDTIAGAVTAVPVTTNANSSAPGATTAMVPVEVTQSTAAPPDATANATSTGAAASPVPKKDNSCFPAEASVEMHDGSLKSMDQVRVGDVVKVGASQFSRVFMFTHRLENTVNEFIRVTVSSGDTLSVTSGHFIYVNGQLAASETVKVGDSLELGSSGAQATVTAISSASMRGLYNPQTLHGDLVVNGIRASTYTTAVEPRIAHAFLSPLRALFSITELSIGLLDGGAPQFLEWLVLRAQHVS
jgi:desert hedgehog